MNTQGQLYLTTPANTLASFKKYLLYSVVFHLVALLGFVIWSSLLEPRKISETKITMIRLTPPKLGVREGSPTAPPGTVTQPGTSTATTQDIPQAKPAPVPQIPKAQPKTPPKTSPKPKAPVATKTVSPTAPPTKAKPKPKSASTLTKQGSPTISTTKTKAPDSNQIASALAGIDEELAAREQSLQQSQTASAGAGGGSGSGQVAALGSPAGSVTARDPGFAQYQSQVRSKIIRNWVRTHASSGEQRLTARVKVRINASGAVISKSLAKGSGDAAFDQSALRAVEHASPLPAPPPSAQAEALRDGFVVDFRARVAGN